MNRLVVVVLLAVGCGTEEVRECDFIHRNICFQMNGYPAVDTQYVDAALQYLEEGIRAHHDESFHMDAVLLLNNITVTYKDPRIMDNRGEASIFNNITIRYVDDAYAQEMGWDDTTEVSKCLDRYYLLQHEMLHVIVRTMEYGTGEQNHDHDLPTLFLWDGGDENAEHYAYSWMWGKCLGWD